MIALPPAHHPMSSELPIWNDHFIELDFFCESVVFADYVAISQVCDDEASDECCDCDDDEVEALYFGRRLQDRLREAKEFIRR